MLRDILIDWLHEETIITYDSQLSGIGVRCHHKFIICHNHSRSVLNDQDDDTVTNVT